jgi:hypothetical protein
MAGGLAAAVGAHKGHHRAQEPSDIKHGRRNLRERLWGLGVASIGRLDQLGGILFPHRAEKMFGMLIKVLCFDVIAVHERGASQREITLVLPFGVGDGLAAASLRRARSEMRCGTAIVLPPARGSLEFLWHFRPT